MVVLDGAVQDADLGKEDNKQSVGQNAQLVLGKTVLKPWGVQWSPRIRHGDYNCVECEWDMNADPKRLFTSIIGFSFNCPPRRPDRTPAVGCVVVECPDCGARFWNHAEAPGVKTYVRLCPLWPKN